MAWLFKRCRYPGCHEQIIRGSYCATHKTQVSRVYDKTRDPESREFYTSNRWRQLRTIQLNQHPLCEVCLLVGRIVTGEHVDHIDGNRDNNSLENLQTLCHSCHSRKHASEGDRFRAND